MTDECGISEQRYPATKPTRCPPMIFRGFAVTLLGIANTMKAVAPIDATIIGCFSIVSAKSAKKKCPHSQYALKDEVNPVFLEILELFLCY
jgi:hypothetical protein